MQIRELRPCASSALARPRRPQCLKKRITASRSPAGSVASVDFVVCRAAFKNFSEPVKALAEMRRVVRPGGTALLIDMRRDVAVTEIQRYVDSLGVSRLNRWFMMLSFRGMLIKRAYPIEEIRRMAIAAGWADPRIDSSPMGFAAWMTK
jgi:SAM-dependent methyltransferase